MTEFEPAYTTQWVSVMRVSSPDRDTLIEEVSGIIQFVANAESEVDTSTLPPVEEQIEDELIESGSAWFYRASQENGDDVDCEACGNTLDDDSPILNNRQGYAFCSEDCIFADHDAGETLHEFEPNGSQDWECRTCKDTEDSLMHNNTERNVEPLLGGRE